MAAVTETARVETFTSNKHVVTAKAACAATGDTWTTGLHVVDWFGVTAIASSGDIYASESAGVITIAYAGGGAVAFKVIAIGA